MPSALHLNSDLDKILPSLFGLSPFDVRNFVIRTKTDVTSLFSSISRLIPEKVANRYKHTFSAIIHIMGSVLSSPFIIIDAKDLVKRLCKESEKRKKPLVKKIYINPHFFNAIKDNFPSAIEILARHGNIKIETTRLKPDPETGRVKQNRGICFENELVRDLKSWHESNGLASSPLIKAVLTHLSHDLLYNNPQEFATAISDVLHQGKTPTKRPLCINNGFLVPGIKKGSDVLFSQEIGDVISDVTLRLDNGKSVYISAKFSRHVSFLNAGIKKWTPHLTELLSALGINYTAFCDSFAAYIAYKQNTGPFIPSVLVRNNSEEIKKKISVFLRHAFGSGYYLVHSVNGETQITKITADYLEQSVKPETIDVFYGNSQCKEVSIIANCGSKTFRIRIRNTSSGLYPDKLTVEVKKTHF